MYTFLLKKLHLNVLINATKIYSGTRRIRIETEIASESGQSRWNKVG